MEFQFDPTRTTQAAAVLLDLNNGCMTRMRLLKFLYIADRELLAETGRTLTGDRAVAMNFGPVLSRTYNLMKRPGDDPEGWGRAIKSHHRELVLKERPGRGRLTKREVDKLQELVERFRGVSTCGLSAYSHGFPEYIRHFVPDTSRPIPWEDVLIGLGKADEAEEIEARQDEQREVDSIFEALNDAGG